MNEGNNTVFCSADYCRELKAKNEELQDKHWSECRQIAHYEDELRKAKELLKAAVEDIHKTYHHRDECCDICKNKQTCTINCAFVWQHEAEALKLIGEDINVPVREDGEQNDT